MPDIAPVQSMLTVNEALRQILSVFRLLPVESIDIADGLDRVLAEDILAGLDLPPFANSSMDGYAVRAADVASARSDAPVYLKVILDIHAGSSPETPSGTEQAARIMTGAPIPPGADAVIPVEQTDNAPSQRHNGFGQVNAHPDRVGILTAGQPGDFIRPVGEDVKTGQRILAIGRVLRAADLGVLAGLGIPRIQVIRQ